MSTLRERLLRTARRQEERHLKTARQIVLRQVATLNLTAAEKALTRALSLPARKRPAAVREALLAIREASAATGTPPAAWRCSPIRPWYSLTPPSTRPAPSPGSVKT